MKRKKEKTADMKNKVIALKHPWMGFADFVKSHLLLAVGIAVFLGLIYGGQAFSNYFYIDKEQLVNKPEYFYNWGEIGRFGLILVKKLLGMSWYNPYLAGAMLLITLWVAAMAAGYLFYAMESRLTAPSLCIFMLLFLVYPTYVEQFLFQFQAFEVVLAIVFLLVSDWYLVLSIREKNGLAFLVSIPPVVISFGIYQSMVPLQLCLYLGIFLMLVYAGNEEKKIISSAIGYSVLHFVVTFGIYEIMVKLFFGGSNYLSGQIVWKTGDYRAAFLYILRYIGTVVEMEEVFYPLTYNLCWVIGLAALLFLFIRYRRKSFWYGLGLLGVVFSPFFLTFVMGIGQPHRTQLVLPLANGVLWLFGIHVISDALKGSWKKFVRVLLTTAGGIMIFLNIAPMMRLFYTRDIIGKADEMTALMIARDLGEIPSVYEEKPVIFIGHRDAMVNHACYGSELAEYETDSYVTFSAFAMDYAFEPYYFFSTHRILGFFRTLGFQDFQGPPNDEMMPSAYEDSEDMPVWPLAGSVREFEDYIIVKLREPALP